VKTHRDGSNQNKIKQFPVSVGQNNTRFYFHFYIDNMFQSIDHNQVIFAKLRERCI